MKRNHLLIGGAIIVGALMLFGGKKQYLGGMSAGSRTSALPGGYRSEAPNPAYNTSPAQ